jgi:hypothetical protein
MECIPASIELDSGPSGGARSTILIAYGLINSCGSIEDPIHWNRSLAAKSNQTARFHEPSSSEATRNDFPA